jgi:hypothetical protein
MNKKLFYFVAILLLQYHCVIKSFAQSTTVKTKADATQISVGDQLRFFIEVTTDTTKTKLHWASIPDTFNSLEVEEKGKIDTTRQGAIVTYKQRLLITGFDSGSFTIPRFTFYNTSTNKTDTLRSDSFKLLVQTVAVDTTKPFKEIKGIVAVKLNWRDYIGYIIGALLIVFAIVAVIIYFINKRKAKPLFVPEPIVETDQERALRLLDELVQKHLWEHDKIKEYYTELTDIVRMYIEARFKTPAMELTTDELLKKAKKQRDMIPFIRSLSSILHTADLAKFAKANPTAEEHIEAIDMAKEFILISKPREEVTPTKPNKAS